MPLFRLTADKSIYQELKDQGIKPSKQAQDQKNLVVTPVATAKYGTVVDLGTFKYNLFDDVDKTTVIAFALAAPIAGVAKKGEYIGIANLEPYEPAPPPPPEGELGPPKKWQLLVDNLNVRADDTLSSKVIGKLKKGKVYTLRQLYGSEPMYRCVEAKGYVALADPKSGKFFWNLVTDSGKVIDVNKASDKDKPPITPTKPKADYGLTPAKPTVPENYAAEAGGLSTTTILLIAGSAVAALYFLMPPKKGKKRR